ncbi:GPW/gp25 family protein [Phaeobacter inhibens]|nr:GPW/gp25 family protein [Phaeobacter inhibens]UWS09829.1 GPW/gp25 family protein [Phaeobacter inhibens]
MILSIVGQLLRAVPGMYSPGARENRQRTGCRGLRHDGDMNGINASTGKPLSGLAHLRQSVRDILTTPIGTRVMRRDYGSRLYRLVDAPMNDATRLEMMAATYEALETWEPRLQLDQVAVDMPEPGGVIVSIQGQYLPTGEPVTLDGIEVR